MESLTAKFEDLVRCMQVLADPAEEKFLEFVESEEEYHKRNYNLEAEVRRLQDQSMGQQKEIKTLEMKLKNARHLLDLEKARRISVENEKNDLAGQISLVLDLFGRGQVNETREKLQQLQNSFTFIGGAEQRRSMRDHSPGPLSTITEDNDSIDTILDVSQMDITEEDELEQSRLRSGKIVKRKSSPERLEKSGQKRRSSKKSEGERHCHEVKTQVTYYTSGDELKKVQTEVKLQPSTPLCSTDESSMEGSPAKRPPRGLAPQPPITPRTNNAHSIFSPQLLSNPITPQQQCLTPYTTPTHTPHTPIMRNYSSASKMNTRVHAFYSKTIYKSEQCQPCGKRVKFGKVALKCRDCRATCHPECRESVPLPCIPTANTPTAKGQLSLIADFTPRVPPMVPALVVHCTNEVENRGLSEIGVYRVPGSEKDVKELKERFLRGKGLPNLSQVDVHVICGTLKDFMRSLKEPLVTHLLWKDFTSAAEKSESQDSAAALYQAISELPQPNRDTMAWIITHLQRVAECPDCKMPVSNLAKVFGPTLVGYSVAEPDPSTMVLETRQQQLVMEKLLEISSDYWSTFINVTDENIYTGMQQPTPETGGSLLGGLPSGNKRRRSLLSRTPLQTR
ncbi:rac GTPase-activating protein 1-like isoform X2 [Homarus americanus]|nr:rac GTPase-activating protein 1-like isoform X2 [Homarus americanus]